MGTSSGSEKHPTREAAEQPRQAPELQPLHERGARAFPDIQLAPERFQQFLLRHLPPDSRDGGALDRLHAHELYLVCAYGLGDRAAHRILESEYLPGVRRALCRLRATDDAIDDVLQATRHALLEMQDPGAEQRGYSGRGELAGWLRVLAVRQLGRSHRRAQRHRSLDEAALELLPLGAAPEDFLARHAYRQQLAEAFREAVTTLTSRERNLLRYHYVSRLNIDQIALLYGIHRATAARWVQRAEERLAAATAERFRRHVPVGEESAQRLLALIHSQLSLSLLDWLPQQAEPEAGT